MINNDKDNQKSLKIIFVFSFLLGLADSLWVYTASSYFKILAGGDNVGWFYSAAFLAVIIILLKLHVFAARWGRQKIFFLSVAGRIFCLLVLLFVPLREAQAAGAVLYLVFAFLSYLGLDMILEAFSTDRQTGRIRGAYLTLASWGFAAGPLISANIVAYYNFNVLFTLLSAYNLGLLVLAFLMMPRPPVLPPACLKAKEIIKKAWQNRDIARIYYISFALEVFYSLMIIYTPFYLLSLGLSWPQLGVVFTVMLLPFLFIQYPLGYLADKKIGEKELTIAALAWLGTAVFLIFFVSSEKVWVWGIMLLAGRLGAATLEIMRDSYFYKKIGGNDVDLVNLYRSARPAAYLVGAALSAVLLYFSPLPAIFIFIGLVVWSALPAALRLKDNLGESEIKNSEADF